MLIINYLYYYPYLGPVKTQRPHLHPSVYMQYNPDSKKLGHLLKHK